MKRLVILAVSILFFFNTSVAQNLAIKSNALYWTSATPNIGLEYSLASRWTIELEGGYNPWTLDKDKNMKLKHWLVSPEVRYWFCNSFQGHFIGLNANYTQFNIGGLPVSLPPVFFNPDGNDAGIPDLRQSRVQGWAVGAGITYGYAFPIARRWNLEFNAGFGWWYTVYDEYESRKCGLFHQQVQKHVLGPTSLGISFVYMIR
jgi:hypothetical protein